MKALIIDDEAPAREILKHMLKEHSSIEIIGEAENGLEAFKMIKELRPELLLLDIQMPKVSGFELLELLDEIPKTIFITAFDEYAIQAFEQGALDYLLKPVNEERLEKALERVANQESESKIKELGEKMMEKTQPLNQLVVKDGSKINVISTEEISFIKAEDDYVSIQTGGARYLKKATMSSLEKALESLGFIRVHRSYLLNPKFLDRVEKWSKDQYLGLTKDGEKIKISAPGYQKLRELLGF